MSWFGLGSQVDSRISRYIDSVVSGGGGVASHAASHLLDGTDEINADVLSITFTPSNYTPSAVTDVDRLDAHLAGIDDELATVAGVTSVFTRTGAVVAAASDYDASQVDNDSGVVGSFVDDALNTLNSGKAATVHTHATGDVTSGTFADARIASSNITQHEGAITHQNLIGAGTQTHTNIDTHISASVAHSATGAVVGTTNSQTLTNKTLTTPTIGDFTNSVHAHEAASGGGLLGHAALENLHIGTSAPGSPSDGDILIDTDDSLLYTYEGTRAHWLGPIIPVYVTWRGNNGNLVSGAIGRVNAVGSREAGLFLPHDYVIVGYTEAAETNPSATTPVISVKRNDVELFTIDVDFQVPDQTSSDTTDVDFASGGRLTCRLEGLQTVGVAAIMKNGILCLWLRRKFS